MDISHRRPFATNHARRGAGKILGIACSVVVMLVVRAGFAGSSSETWMDRFAVDNLKMSTPRPFEDGSHTDKMRQNSMHSAHAYVEVVAADIPEGGEYDLDAGMQGVIDLVAARPGNAIEHKVVAHERILGLPGASCHMDLTRDGVTKPVEVRLFCVPDRAYGVIAVGDESEVKRMISSMHIWKP